MFLAVISALVGYFNRFLRIDMTESLEILFKECEGGGDYDGLCQYVIVAVGPAGVRQLTNSYVQVWLPVADGQLPPSRHHHPHVLDYPVVWLQSPCRYLCPVHGRRSCIRENGGDHCEGDTCVRAERF